MGHLHFEQHIQF